MNLFDIFKRPKFYFDYFLKSLKPYKIEINGKSFFVKYRPFWEDVQKGKWEPYTFKIFDKFLDPDHSFIDIGAWIGATAFYGCQIARHCYAIEPDPVAFRQLNYNLNMNSNLKSKISLYNFCISDKCGKVKLGNKSSFGNSMSTIMFKDFKNFLFVKSLTLEKFLQLNKIKDCNFIKMDIEGGEIIVLPSIRNFLKERKPTLHLSLHPQFFENKKKDSQLIIETISIYKNIFNNCGQLLKPEELFLKLLIEEKSFDIVVTDIDY